MSALRGSRPWLVLAGGDFLYKGVMAVYWVLLARKLSMDDLGVVALANAIGMPAFVIVDAGLNAILVRDYSETGGLPAGHRRRVNRRLGFGLFLLAPLAALGFLLEHSLEAALAAGLMSLAYYFDFGGQLMLAPARAATRMEPDATVRAIQALGAVAITIAFLAAGLSSPAWIVFASTVSYGVAMLPAWQVWRHSDRWAEEIPTGEFRLPEDASAVSQATVLMTAFNRADSLIVQAILGPAALAVYTVAYKLLEVARLVPGALSRIVLARSSDVDADGYDLRSHFRTSVALSLLGMVVLLVAGPFLIGLLFGAEYRGPATTPVRLLGLSIVPFAILTVGSMYAIGIGEGFRFRRIAVESFVVLLVAMVTLSYGYDLDGAAAGMLIGQGYAGLRFWLYLHRSRHWRVDRTLAEESWIDPR